MNGRRRGPVRLPPLRLPRLRWLRPRGPRAARRRAIGLALLLLALAYWWAATPARQTWPREQILAAIRMVESGGRSQPPDGDGGLAIGPYQIHEVYWRDAVAFRPALGGTYQDCRQRAYAEQVIAAYMAKWVPAAWAAGDAETIARVHNGGPEGHRRASTAGYWAKVRARLP